MVNPEKQVAFAGLAPPHLINGGTPLKTAVIATRGDFDSLFEGFESLRAVSYVVSPDLLLELFTDRGFSRVEIVVGEHLTRRYKEVLSAKDIEITEALAERVEGGSLRILTPRGQQWRSRTIHSKLYILEKGDMIRLINGSANLTDTAQEATAQMNYVWYLDTVQDDPSIATIIEDYGVHARRCQVFMEDLLTLMKQPGDIPKKQVIEAWLSGETTIQSAQVPTRVLGELTADALDIVGSTSEPIFSLRLPDVPAERRETEKVLAKLGVTTVGNSAEVNRSDFLKYIEKTINVPPMAVNLDRNQITLAINGKVAILNHELGEPEAINRALEHLEHYVDTIDLGQSLDKPLAKMAMFEAILYCLAAPFANEHMKIMRRAYGVHSGGRGPRFLYLFGRSSNGKSTFLKFALSLLTGHITSPLPSEDFTKSTLSNAAAFGTCFPLVFDDVGPTKVSGFNSMKLYWESWWSVDRVLPQIIVSSNNRSLQPWLRTRVKRVDFDVYFTETSESKIALRKIMEEPNPLFPWFTTLYLQLLGQIDQPHDDELHLARTAMQQLYVRAGRNVPSFFPDRPLELIHDPGRALWLELLYGSQRSQATCRRENSRLVVEFRDDLQRSELARYETALAEIVKREPQGRILMIDNPEAFYVWLGKRPPTRWWQFGKLLSR